MLIVHRASYEIKEIGYPIGDLFCGMRDHGGPAETGTSAFSLGKRTLLH